MFREGIDTSNIKNPHDFYAVVVIWWIFVDVGEIPIQVKAWCVLNWSHVIKPHKKIFITIVIWIEVRPCLNVKKIGKKYHITYFDTCMKY